MKKKKQKKIDNNIQKEEKIVVETNEYSNFRLGNFFKKNKVIILLTCIFTLLIYANIISGDFVNLDDYSKAFLGPEFKDIKLALKSFDGFVILMYAVVNIFGINSSVFHVVAIISHMINGIFVFLLLYLLFGKKISIVGTFMFLAHPTNTEAISWHAGYPYAMRAHVLLPILIFFTLFKKTKKKIYLLISAFVYILSLIFFRGGGWMLITPFILVFMDQFIIEKKIKFKNIIEYSPYLVPSIIFLVTLIPTFLKGRLESLETLYYVDTSTATPLFNRIPYTIYMEYKTLFYPMTLSIYHEGKYITPAEYTFMVFVTMVVIFAIFYFWKRDRRITGLILMIIFGVLPSFSPVIVAWIAAERYLYVPSIFSSVIVILGLLWFDKNILKNKSDGKISKFFLYSSITIILLYSVRTVFRNNDLRNSKNLWTASKKTAPYSYRVYNNMGDVLANEGDLEGALENFKRSVALKPDYADAVHNIGHIYMQIGNVELAKKYLQQSLDMNPRLYPSAYKIGLIYLNEGDVQKSKEYFEQCLQYDPTSIDCGVALQNVTKMIEQ